MRGSGRCVIVLTMLVFLAGCLNTQNRNPMKSGDKSAVTTATVITLTRIPRLDELEGDDMFEDPIPDPDEGHSEYF